MVIPSSPSKSQATLANRSGTSQVSGFPTMQSASQAAPSGLSLNYRPSTAYDEMCLPDGTVRPHWQSLARTLQQFTPADLEARRVTVQRLLRDHGVTYHVYEDATGFTRPWALDLLPVIISAEDHRKISAGLEQRARLMELILADIYGPQHLLKEGWIPPALLHANPGYIRAICGVLPPGGRFLVVSGTDLLRQPDGSWAVLADRTQSPSGKGYSLENRIIMTNVFGEEFKEARVQRLASFYDMEREALRALAPSRRGTPSVVMLTPGPYNETYFEHAFKARYLGFPLVEGADLTVRDRRVHLKTLEGLRRVDVISRRVDELFCDPLEMNVDTWLGVPGMVEAWRSGNVALANGLGTGAVETPALYPFMPGLCRHLLNEELKLPCAPTWWCGQKRELDMVIAAPERWVLKPAFTIGVRNPVFLADLDERQRAAAIARVRAEPHAWVAQEMLNLSTTPTLVNGTLQPRALVWRAFTLGSGDHHVVMPGGLSRVSAEQGRFVVTMHSGGISKDTWVIAEGEVDQLSLLKDKPLVVRPARPPGGVPSRVADHLFWLGRYAERLEQTVRVLRTLWQRLSGEGSDTQGRELRCCARLLESLKLVPPGLVNGDMRPPLTRLHTLLHDPACEGSVRELLGRLRHNASAARDRLSDDTWRLFNRIERDVLTGRPGLAVSDALAMLDTLILDLAAFSGMQLENMTRGHGWRFLEIGRRVERSVHILTLVGAATRIAEEDDAVLMPMLEICDSSMTYRRLHFSKPRLIPVLDLLLLNEINPRSAIYQIDALRAQARQLPAEAHTTGAGRERALAEEIYTTISGLSFANVAEKETEALTTVPAHCERLLADVEAFSELLTQHYFSHATRGTA
jgi:uncharacterized circularly permuted ATP-grasp superfamily protein/uncharacterized alpha-E superfamily protein